MTEEQRNGFYHAVKEWNKAVGNYEGMFYPKILHPSDGQEIKELRESEVWFIREEIIEGRDAIMKGDKIESLDAKIDTAYTALWTIHKMGYRFIPSQAHEQAQNDIRYSRVSFIELMEVLDDIEKQSQRPQGKERKEYIVSKLHYIVQVSLLLAEEETDRVFDACMEVCRSNFSKLWAGKDENGKVVKWDGYRKPELGQYLLLCDKEKGFKI